MYVQCGTYEDYLYQEYCRNEMRSPSARWSWRDLESLATRLAYSTVALSAVLVGANLLCWFQGY